jgi:DNA invertase Pin-like site-specific DNA recombinase
MELSEEARKLRNEYQRQYRQKNRDKIRQYNVNYWERKARESSPENQVKELSEQGLTQREISDFMGISLGLVNKLLKQSKLGEIIL